MKESGCEVSDWMMALKAPSKNLKKNVKARPVQRYEIKTVSKYDDGKQKRKRDMIEGTKNRKKEQLGI